MYCTDMYLETGVGDEGGGERQTAEPGAEPRHRGHPGVSDQQTASEVKFLEAG